MVVRNSAAITLKRLAGRLGGRARIKMYGNPGTKEGRRKGGKNSIRAHRDLNTGFKKLQKITRPERTEAYAEFIGILIGDGHLDRYQVSITTNSETDLAHAKHIQSLAESLFGISSSINHRRDSKAVVVLVSSKAVCDVLLDEGLTRGSKQRLGVRFPQWIQSDPIITRRCVRGLFDSDGCVFQDTHKIKGRTYKSLGIAFANNEPNVLKFFFSALVEMGMHPTQTSKHRVFLRRSQEIARYFEVVGTSNPKHRSRFEAFRKG